MGLGAHGGGAATARYCVEQGARVIVTDLRSRSELAESVEQLSGLPITFVLGEHRNADFREADIVVKNPAVPRSSLYLKLARRIETDISLFLSEFRGTVLAVTGTKGKSTTTSALHHILSGTDHLARLGGNITVSPLSFLPSLYGDETVVLELSSFQLGDLKLTPIADSSGPPGFAVSIVTNLLEDHQDYYPSMDAYADDKKLIFRGQKESDWVILSADDGYSRDFAPPVQEKSVRVTAGPERNGVDAWITGGRGYVRLPGSGYADPVELVPETLRVVGEHQRTNLLFAGIAALLQGRSPDEIRQRLSSYGGIPHRLEYLRTVSGVHYYNDSAATIAEASSAATASFQVPVHLIAGGSDKGLPLDAIVDAAGRAATVHLLAGSATDRIVPLLQDAEVQFSGPHDSLDEALMSAVRPARREDVVLLSPGCASFGMFRNEFDRGDQFRSLVDRLEA